MPSPPIKSRPTSVSHNVGSSNVKALRKLLIVESPGKLATLRKILGSGWAFEASVGHTTELAHDGAKKLGFDLTNNQVITRYIPRLERGKRVLAQLRRAVKLADIVYLATDSDREGEAIAWHLVEQLKLKKYVRISYTQITAPAIQAALAQPRELNFPMVHAQRARQCLDKLVGYEVSPLLWKSSGGKSAGRVQSATLRLVCAREIERLNFRPEDYWTLQAKYIDKRTAGATSVPPQIFKAGFEHAPSKDSNPMTKARVKSAQDAARIKTTAETNPHFVRSVVQKLESKPAPPPLITSSLQQVAGVRFKFSPQHTMKIAQQLYEGIGGQGLITYMRTDAVLLSPEFIQDARAWLRENAPEALPLEGKEYQSKAGAQAAHEAIRPTQVSQTPERMKDKLSSDQFLLYDLIWTRAIASQCSPAKLAKTDAVIESSDTRWVASGMQILSPGYLRFWKNVEDEFELPKLEQGQVLNLKEISVEKKTTTPPPRYSEAKLVQLMERSGIGRPSTYASTIATLKEREYVVIEKESLKPTRLGLNTDLVLVKAMPELVDLNFTAQMEKSLDQIADRNLEWQEFLCRWNREYLQSALLRARQTLAQDAELRNMS